MKTKIACFGLWMLLHLGLSAQNKKILFDATKAEMASNADWVIDADKHDIGTGSGGVMTKGSGSESNPQRYPTPAQSTITSSTTEDYWEGAISAWAIQMVKRGYQVETLPYNGKITYGDTLNNPQDLSFYKVFVVDEPNTKFTSAEVTAILAFVKNGGGLFMISDHDKSDRNNDGWDSPHIWNDLLKNNPFGITFDYTTYSESSNNYANLPGDTILGGPAGKATTIKFNGATTMTLDNSKNPTAQGIIYRYGMSNKGGSNVMLARARYGKGKVIGIADSSPFEDGTGDPGDNLYSSWTSANDSTLIVNATYWLSIPEKVINTAIPLESLTKMGEIIVSPNPVNGILTVQSMEERYPITSIKIINQIGQTVSSEGSRILKNSIMKMDLINLTSGIYFLQVQSNEHVTYKKIIKE